MNPNPPADKSPHGSVRFGPEQERAGGPGETGTGNSPHDSATPMVQHRIPSIPDHELLRRIGGGSYGEVWLARNVLGEFRAVKVIYRDKFEHDRPFEREFEGIQKFEPISRLHESQVDILHVGRNEAAGYFYYVMELADDAGAVPNYECRHPKEARNPKVTSNVVAGNLQSSGLGIPSSLDIRNSDLYIPHTLKLDLYRRSRLLVDECIQTGLALTTALEHLHSHGLVHRDIKPSNIIFVRGVPKMADVGLVANMDATMSLVGTPGFLPPEGPGTPQGDIYSLGKVLYELSTGRDRQEFPKLPPNLAEFEDPQRLLELNAIILKACHRDPRQRYQTAKEMAADLALLQRGESVRRKRIIGRRLALGAKVLSALAVVGLIVIGGYFFRGTRYSSVSQHKRVEHPEVTSLCKLGRFHYYKITDEGCAKAMKYFNQALQLDPNSVEAYVGIADLCNVALPWSRFLPPKKAEEKMRWVRQKLMVIDSRLAEGHAIQGFINLVFDWKPEAAEKELKQALELDPDLSVAHIWYGKYLLFTKKFEEAERELKTAQRLDPIRYGLKVHVALPSFFEHRYDRAMELFEQAFEVAPGLNWAIWMIGRAHEEKGDYPSAIKVFQRAQLAQGGNPDVVNQKYAVLSDAYEKSGPDGYWRKKLDFVQREFEGWGASQALEVAAVYARLDDREMALRWLDKAFQEKSDDLFWLNVDPCWDNIRSDPRFVALLKKMGFAPNHSEHPEVATLCKLGRFHYNKLTEEGYAKATECFNKALEIDPNSVEAYTSIADLCVGSQPCQLLPPKAAEAKMRWAGDRLVAIDSGLAEAHAVRGYIELVYEWNPDDAQKELELALQLNPELLVAHVWHGRYLLFAGKFEASERAWRKARQLDPSRYGLNVFVGLPSFFARRYDRAIKYFQEAIEVVPSHDWGFRMIGRSNEEKGDFRAAIEAFERAELANGGKVELVKQRSAELLEVSEKSGEEGYWRKQLAFAQNEYGGWRAWLDALDVARIYAHLGDADRALAWLDKAFQEKSQYLLWLSVDPCWDNIRSDPRFVALLNRMGFGGSTGKSQPLSPAELAGTRSQEAYMKYEQGRAAERQGNAEGDRAGMNFVREALELDPGFLRAWAELFVMFTNSDAPDAKNQERAIAKKLGELNADSADAHSAQAWLAYEDFDFARADKEFRRAIQADSSRRWPHGYYACFLTQCGRLEEARKQLGEAEMIEPGRPAVQYLLGDCFFVERKYPQALAQYEKSLRLAQQEVGAYWRLGRLYEADHRIRDAIAAFEKLLMLNGEDSQKLAQRYEPLRRAFERDGERGYWTKRLEQAEAELDPEKEPYNLAIFHARLGDTEQTLTLLEKAWKIRDIGLKFLILDQHWDDLRDNERFKELLRKIGYRTDWPVN